MELDPNEVIEISFPEVAEAKVVFRRGEDDLQSFSLVLLFPNGARINAYLSDDFIRHAFGKHERDRVQLEVERSPD